MTSDVHISLMLAVQDAPAAVDWYKRALGVTELWNLGGVAGLSIASAPFFVGERENNGWDTPAAAGTRTVRVEVFTEDPDGLIQRAVAAGADGSIDEIRDHQVPWGTHRQGGFIDPFGHLWLVGTSLPCNGFRQLTAERPVQRTARHLSGDRRNRRQIPGDHGRGRGAPTRGLPSQSGHEVGALPNNP